MKLKALISLLSGLLESIATILFGTAEQRQIEEKDEKRTLVYVALKTLANAKTYDQVLDALGFFSEALDFVEEKHTDLVDRMNDYKLWVAELQGDKQNVNNYSKECDLLREELARTQKELGYSRKANDRMRKNYNVALDARLENMKALKEIINDLETKCNAQDKLLDQHERGEIYG